MKTMKWIKYFVLFICCWMGGDVWGNNVKVSLIDYDPDEVRVGQNILTLNFNVSWDHAWRDDYNHDAVYVFLKYRKKSEPGTEWHPLYIESCRVTDSRYSCELASGGVTDSHIGFYVFLNNKGNGTVDIPIEIKWNIKSNTRKSLTNNDVNGNDVLLSAYAIEMVRVPRGPFRAGDNLKDGKVFWRDYVPFPASADLISSASTLRASSGEPYQAADHVGGSIGDTTSCWIPVQEDKAPYWTVDFGTGNKKVIRYLGICGVQGCAVPQVWRLKAQESKFDSWIELFSKSAADWVVATNSAYPIEQTIETKNTKAYQLYRLEFEGITGTLAIKSISMTDVDNPLIKDHTVLVDRDSLVLESKRNFGAQDGTAWSSGAVVKSDYPNGYKEFYAMKYELTQEQYVSFLNTLTWAQQQALIPGLAAMEEGDYIFGPRRDTANCRNGIIVERKVAGLPMVFANNLNPDNLPGNADDGQTLACNYLSLKDLQAYAAWSGLRPMTELEFEKLGRPLYSYTAIPQMGEYAWNSLGLEGAKNIQHAGSPREQAEGNANYNGTVGGPLRNGVFAGSGTQNREACGVSYWGVFELSGNLAEPYYNVNASGRVFKGKDFVSSHGNGYLTAAALPESANVASWPSAPAAFALRGGDFESTDVHELSVSDRRYFQNYWKDVNERDSTVGIRLGRRCVEDENVVINTLALENGEIGSEGHIVYDTINDGENYIISGSGAAEVGPTYSVLWYKSEDDSREWALMEGFTDKDLNLANVIGRFGTNGKMREYRYRRKIVTPQGESMAQVGLRVVDPTFTIDTSRAVFVYGGSSHGITVTSQSLALKVTWTDVETGTELAATSSNQKSSTLCLTCNVLQQLPDFKVGKDRKIKINLSIYDHIFREAIVTYKMPMPTYAFDKKSVVIGTGAEGIRLNTSHPVNVSWLDVKGDKELLINSNVRTSFCHPIWTDFTNPQPNEVRKNIVMIASTDGCYFFQDSVDFVLPNCVLNNPFAGSLAQQTFTNTNGSINTLQVTSNWNSDSSIPKTWKLEGSPGGITINQSGVLSGLQGTICSVTVSLADARCPTITYKKTVKETYRNFTSVTSHSIRLSSGSFQLECWGAEGGGSRLSGNSASGLGGYGGYSVGTLNLTSAQTVYVYVGGQGGSSTNGTAYGGWNGGGNGYASSASEPGNGGGGASDIRIGGTTVYYRLIVAGGGGGGGEDSSDSYGHGGGTSGSGSWYPGQQTSAGSGGGFGTGGSTGYGDGGGGGGGWYGGGTSSSSSKGDDTQGGGGGSGFVWTSSTRSYVPSSYGVSTAYYLQNASTSSSSRTGNGLVRITVK